MELTNCNLSNGHAAQNHLWNRCKKNKTLNSFSSHDIYRNETMTPVFHQILPRAGAGGWGWFRMRPRRLLFAIFPNEFLHLQRKIKSWAGERKKIVQILLKVKVKLCKAILSSQKRRWQWSKQNKSSDYNTRNLYLCLWLLWAPTYRFVRSSSGLSNIEKCLKTTQF